MGLSALRKVLAPEPCDPTELSGAAVAVDANNLLWAFVTGMARGGAPTGPHGRPISHVIGLCNRLELYARWGVQSAWVFDGAQPALKQETLDAREARIQAAKEAGDEVAATRLQGREIREVQELLDALGVPWLVAPGEGDAQLAHWVRQGRVEAAVTQDYDIALHGCPVAYRNLKETGRRGPERMVLAAALEREGLSHQQLVDAAILIGTDYNDGLRGVGPVTAVKLVREHGDLHGALAARDARIPEAEAIRALFLEHKVDEDVAPRSREPDEAVVTKLLGEHGLSAPRSRSLVNAIARL